MATITQTDPTALVRELHATALALAQAKARVQADPSAPNIAAAQMLLQHFRDVANAYRATGAGDLTAYDKIILDTGNYLAAAVAALPAAIAALPTQVTKGLLAGLWPWVLGGAALWWFTAGPGLRSRGGQTWR